MFRLAATALLATALAQGVAFAQNDQSAKPSPDNGLMNSAQKTQSIPDEIKSQLKDQGYTDVEIIPGSLLVSAKDKDGNPVRMVVGPHSITTLTLKNSSTESSTTGSSAGQ